MSELSSWALKQWQHEFKRVPTSKAVRALLNKIREKLENRDARKTKERKP